MASSYNDSVMSFDLALLQQPSNNIDIRRAVKYRKNVAKLKSRMLTVHAVVNRCADLNETLEACKKSLLASKEECKQLCIDNKNVLEKCENLENDVKTLQLHNQQLNHKLIDAENQFCGMQSLAKQLEVLVKEREIQIESLTVERNLEKANSRKYASKVTSLQKRNERLLRDLCTFGKFLQSNKRLPTAIRDTLSRYSKDIKEDNEDSCHESNGDHSDIDEDVFDSKSSTTKSSQEINIKEDQTSSVEIQEMIVVNINKTNENGNTSNYRLDEMDLYSDCSNEIASADTGRGSSLAFSDGEKCFLSPDPFLIDNHDSPEIISKVTKETSPKRVIETTDIATSPIRTETPILIPIITIDTAVGPDESISNENVPCLPNCSTKDIVSAPTMIDASLQTDTIVQEVQVANVQEYQIAKVQEVQIENVQEVQFENDQEKQCLKVNSSNHCGVEDDIVNYEVEMILKKMKFNHKLISPIPTSPINSRKSVSPEVPKSQQDLNVIDTMTKQIQFLLHSQTKMLKAIDALRRQNMNSTLQHSDSSKDDLLNVEKDISQLAQLSILNLNGEERAKSMIENSNTVEFREEHDNCSEIEKSLHYNRVSLQSQNINEPDLEDLIEMADLIDISNHESMPLNDFIISDNSELISDEQMIDSLIVNTEAENPSISVGEQDKNPSISVEEQDKNPSINVEAHDNSSVERMVGRLEFEEDTVCALPIQRLDLNTQTFETSETTTVDNQPPASNLLCSNDKIRRKIRKLNNLEKLRRKLIPKCKIQRDKILATRPRVQKHNCIGRLNAKNPKKTITAADSSVSLNDKKVYDNAVRIMAEFKSKEPIHKSVLKSNRAKKVKNMRLLKLKRSETHTNPAKKQSDTKELAVDKLITHQPKSPEKPFDISNLMSKLIPVNKVTTKTKNKCMGNNKKVEENQNLKIMQPVILINRLQDKGDLGQEIRYDKTSQYNIDNNNTSESFAPNVNTRRRGKCIEKSPDDEQIIAEGRKPHKRISSDDNDDIEHKRILRSSTRQISVDENLNNLFTSDNLADLSKNNSTHSKSPKLRKCTDDTNNFSLDNCNRKSNLDENLNGQNTPDNLVDRGNNDNNYSKSPKLRKFSNNANNSTFDNVSPTTHKDKEHNISISYDDLDMFDETIFKRPESLNNDKHDDNPKDSILCTMLEKYSLSKLNYFTKKIPEHAMSSIVKLIDENLEIVNKLPPSETRKAMDDFVEKLQAWKWKEFIAAFMKYLQNPQRKVELYSKVNSPPAPPMTKYEQILLYVIIKLKRVWPEVDIVNSILSQMEYVLFKINQTPDFDVIESMSHFYAAICRCFGMRLRLRSFMLDAMYCIQFKAIALVKQCIDVWMHVIPLAHMGIAKNPLVSCLVYLLHFYKCEDHFNRVQDIRNILLRKYFYQMSEWNEKRILEVVKNAIYEVKGNPEEKKILRRSILILAKRQGPRWCQKNIIMNMLLPIIENKNSPENVKLFCIRMLGPLMKPYPPDMKVHCEIVMNTLLDITKQKPSPTTQEAVFISLIYMSKHNHSRVIRALLSWHPKHKISSECYAVLRDFVKDKPAHSWRKILSNAYLANEVGNGRLEDQNLDIK